MHFITAGALAGAAATVPMTILMRAGHARLPERERYPLPPEQITATVARGVGVPARPEQPGWEAKTYAAHFAYGATVGAAYAAIGPRLPGHPAIKGAAFGLAVWAGSYLGWLPAVGLFPPATREPAGRNLLMLAAHAVYGAAAGALGDRLAEPAGGRRGNA